MPVNPVAAKGFARAADAYVRGRPSYPREAIEWLARQCALGPGATVVDVAAGTGKLTEVLAPLGATVIAVEPVDAMRAALEAALPERHGARRHRRGAAAARRRAPTRSPSGRPTTGSPASRRSPSSRACCARAAASCSCGTRATSRGRCGGRCRGSSIRCATTRPSTAAALWRESLAATERFRRLEAEGFSYHQLVGRDGPPRPGRLDQLHRRARRRARRAAVLEEITALVADESEPLSLDYLTEVYVFERVAD